MKKTIAILLIISLILPLMGCNNSTTENKEQTTTESVEVEPEKVEEDEAQSDEEIKSDKITGDTFILGVVGLEYI